MRHQAGLAAWARAGLLHVGACGRLVGRRARAAPARLLVGVGKGAGAPVVLEALWAGSRRRAAAPIANEPAGGVTGGGGAVRRGARLKQRVEVPTLEQGRTLKQNLRGSDRTAVGELVASALVAQPGAGRLPRHAHSNGYPKDLAQMRDCCAAAARPAKSGPPFAAHARASPTGDAQPARRLAPGAASRDAPKLFNPLTCGTRRPCRADWPPPRCTPSLRRESPSFLCPGGLCGSLAGWGAQRGRFRQWRTCTTACVRCALALEWARFQ